MITKAVLIFGIFLGSHLMFVDAYQRSCTVSGIPFINVLPICFVKYVRIAIEEAIQVNGNARNENITIKEATQVNLSLTNETIKENLHFNYIDCVSKRMEKQLKSYTDDIQDIFGDDVTHAIENAKRKIQDFIKHDAEDFFVHGIKDFFENDVNNFFKEDVRKFFENYVKKFFIEDVDNFFRSNVTIFFNRDVKNFFEKDVKNFFVEDVKNFFEEDVKLFFERDVKGIFVTPSTNGCQKEEYRIEFLILSLALSILLYR